MVMVMKMAEDCLTEQHHEVCFNESRTIRILPNVMEQL